MKFLSVVAALIVAASAADAHAQGGLAPGAAGGGSGMAPGSAAGMGSGLAPGAGGFAPPGADVPGVTTPGIATPSVGPLYGAQEAPFVPRERAGRYHRQKARGSAPGPR